MLLCAIESGLLLSYMVVNDPGLEPQPFSVCITKASYTEQAETGPCSSLWPPVPGGKMAGVHVCLQRMNLFIKTKGASKQQSSQLSARLKVAETPLGH